MKHDFFALTSSMLDMEFVKKHSLKLHELERLTDNSDFQKSTEYVCEVMREAGFSEIERYAIPMDGVTTYDDCTMPLAWDRTGRSTLEIIDPQLSSSERMLADSDIEPLNATIWSPPTPPGGVTAELVSLQAVDSEDWHELSGKIVLCDRSPGGDLMYKLALSGAVGLVSYVAETMETNPDDVRWMNGVGHCGWYYVKDDPMLWNFSITPRRGAALAARLAAGEKITLKAVMNTKVYSGETYTVTGIIPGKSKAELALIAHMYEPFIPDDSAGVVLAIAIGKALRSLVMQGAIPKLEKTIRVVFSMERYGFSEYFGNHERSRKIIAAVNMDSVCHSSLQLAGVLPELRHSPASAPFFTEILLRQYLSKYCPELPFIETPGNLSDDTFAADSVYNIPTNWLHTQAAAGRHHNSGEIFAGVDWQIAHTAASVTAAAFAEMALFRNARSGASLIRQVEKGIRQDAASDFKRLEKLLTNGTLNSYAGNVIGDFLINYHCRRFAGLNALVDGAVKLTSMRGELRLLRSRYAPLSLQLNTYELSNSELRLAYMTVERDPQVAQIMSMTRLPAAERHGFIAKPGMLMNALLDGKRNLYEAYVISNFMLRKNGNFKTAAGLVQFYKKLAEYGYYKIKYAEELTKDDLTTALKALEVKPTDKLIVHSAYGSLGAVKGGPATVVEALIEHCGKKGVLMMPSFNFPFYMHRSNDEYFDLQNTPSCVGVVTDEFRKHKDVYRSLNPSHSIAVYGKKNFHWIKDHHCTLTMGQDSPLGKLEKADGYALMINCPDSVTFMHVVEMTNHTHCLGLRTEEFKVKLPDGRIESVRTWGWRGGSCAAYNKNAIFNYLRKHGLITEVMVRHSLWQYFKLSDYRKAYTKAVLCGKFGCMQCKVLPRQVQSTVISDWDSQKNCVKSSTSAFTGDWEA
ncbi:MAG: hypothetical protein E7052_09895 [Lentisphaerae bacterium]|nr:hypothetical protein [Lentisphaerota bacterium]